ncbi:uncharacterized protein LOC143047233 isoform X2 [Mytilus galloprovincialis]|uniref:uncharacterized protein LOC143047233 isoform X2 n=1 Tax=Mytilus galloprovincialis TaxID=29158 RepID=UPI003F7C52BF
MDRRGTPLSVQYELDSLCIQEGCDLNSSKPTKTTKYELDSSCDKDNPVLKTTLTITVQELNSR